jgi:hypothetical protein
MDNLSTTVRQMLMQSNYKLHYYKCTWRKSIARTTNMHDFYLILHSIGRQSFNSDVPKPWQKCSCLDESRYWVCIAHYLQSQIQSASAFILSKTCVVLSINS